jgi:hypothetical protein
MLSFWKTSGFLPTKKRSNGIGAMAPCYCQQWRIESAFDVGILTCVFVCDRCCQLPTEKVRNIVSGNGFLGGRRVAVAFAFYGPACFVHDLFISSSHRTALILQISSMMVESHSFFLDTLLQFCLCSRASSSIILYQKFL